MSKSDESKSKADESTSLDKIAAGAKALRDIAAILTQAIKVVAKKLRPDYRECAASFRIVALTIGPEPET
jgi:hypothetical protein